jgi:starch-binding outer membrane protein, SusD/RagB family
MKKQILIISTIFLMMSSCDGFLELSPEHLINEQIFYKTAADFETALMGTYAPWQNLHNYPLTVLGELTTDNAEVTWSSPTTNEAEANENEITSTNGFVGAVWSTGFQTVSRCNNILNRIEGVEMNETLKSQYKAEALFLRAYSYFYLVRFFGDLPIIERAFTSPNEVAQFNMTRKPMSEVYQLIINDLTTAAGLFQLDNLPKSRASKGAAKTLLGKVYLTKKDYGPAATVLKEVIDMNVYSLAQNYKSLFTNNNNNLPESIFEIPYLSGGIGEGNSFASMFTPPRFDMAIFPGNMQGSGRVMPTLNMVNAYEPGDLRRAASIGDSVRLVTGNYAHDRHALKFVDFTVGLQNDGGINFTSLRYADVLLMYAEALNETEKTLEAHTYINLVRNRANLVSLTGLTKAEFSLALERERRVEFYCEGHRWHDLVRTGRAQAVINNYWAEKGLGFSLQTHEVLMPIPSREINIDPKLKQNPNY